MTPIESIKKRPDTFRERSAQAEELYRTLFAKFKTHKFIDWVISTQVQEEDFTTAVPPYCFRFDEFLGFWLSGGLPQEVPSTMERYFPEPDEMDCSYLEDILAELEKVEGGPRDVHITWKGSKVGIGPGVCWCYSENISRAQKWVREVKEKLSAEKSLRFAPPVSRVGIAYSAQTTPSLASFFQNGFTIKEFDSLLMKLGMMSEGRRITDDSKPRTWVSLIQALLDRKMLLPPSKPALYDALIKEYGNQSGLPKLRSIQGGYKADNSQARDFYTRAMALLKAE